MQKMRIIGRENRDQINLEYMNYFQIKVKIHNFVKNNYHE